MSGALCSRNARPQKALVRRAHLSIHLPVPSEKKERGSEKEVVVGARHNCKCCLWTCRLCGAGADVAIECEAFVARAGGREI